MQRKTVILIACLLQIFFSTSSAFYIYSPANIFSWGANNNGVLGNGEKVEYQFGQRVIIPQLPSDEHAETFSKIMASDTHVLASTSDGRLYGWGKNCDGALGLLPTLSTRAYPFEWPGILVKDFAVSSCASWLVNTDGALYKVNGTSIAVLNSTGIDRVACGGDFCAAWAETDSSPIYWFPTASAAIPSNMAAYTENGNPLRSVSIGSRHALLRYSATVLAYGDDSVGQIHGGGTIYTIADGDTVQSAVACEDYSIIVTARVVLSFGNSPIPGCDGITGVCFSFLSPTVQGASCAGPVAYVLLINGSILSYGDDENLLGYNPQYSGSLSRQMPVFAQISSLALPSTSAKSMYAIGSDLTPVSGPHPIQAWGWGANHFGQLGTGQKSFGDTLAPLASQKETFVRSRPTNDYDTDIWGHMTFYSSGSGSVFLEVDVMGETTAVHTIGSPGILSASQSNLFPRTLASAVDSRFLLASTESSWISLNGTILDGVDERFDVSPVLDGLSFDFASDPRFTFQKPSLKCGYVTCIISLNASYHLMWGSNETGQIPRIDDSPGSTSFPFAPNIPVLLDWTRTASTSVALAREFTAVLFSSTEIRFFGTNVNFGTGFLRRPDDGSYQYSSDSSQFSSISAGYNHTVILDVGAVPSRVLAIGDNQFGQLGSTDLATNWAVINVPDVIGWLSVAAVQHASFGVAKISTPGFSAHFALYSWGLTNPQVLLGHADRTLQLITPPTIMTPNFALGVEGMQYVDLCQYCRGSSMFVFASVQMPTAAEAPAFLPPETVAEPSYVGPFRISFGENEFGSLGLGTLRSPVLPTRSEISLVNGFAFGSRGSGFPAGNLTATGTFASHSRAGSVLSRPTDNRVSFWRSYNTSFPDIPLLRTGYSLLSAPALGTLPSPSFVDATGDSGVFGASTDSIFKFNFTACEWALEHSGATGITSIRSTPVHIDNYESSAWVATQNVFGDSVISSPHSASFPTAIAKEVFMTNNGDIFAVLVGDVLSVQTGSDPITLSYVVAADMGHYVMAARRSDWSVWTIQTNNPHAMNLLGRTGPTNQWAVVSFPSAGRIIQVECANLVSYALDHTGNVFAWGLAHSYLFGTYDANNYFELPSSLSWTIDPIIIPTTHQITMLSSDSWRDVHFWASNRTVDIFTACDEVPPSTDFICVGGVWTLFQPFLNNSLTVTGYTVVDANITLSGNINFGNLLASLNSSSCVSINGSVVIILSDEELLELLQNGSPTTIQLISALCGHLGGQIQLLFNSNPCLNVGVETIESTTDGYSLSGLFSVSESGTCNPNTPDKKKNNNWWIIVVSVVAGIVFIIAITALLVTFTPLKTVVRPFSKRADE